MHAAMHAERRALVATEKAAAATVCAGRASPNEAALRRLLKWSPSLPPQAADSAFSAMRRRDSSTAQWIVFGDMHGLEAHRIGTGALALSMRRRCERLLAEDDSPYWLVYGGRLRPLGRPAAIGYASMQPSLVLRPRDDVVAAVNETDRAREHDIVARLGGCRLATLRLDPRGRSFEVAACDPQGTLGCAIRACEAAGSLNRHGSLTVLARHALDELQTILDGLDGALPAGTLDPDDLRLDGHRITDLIALLRTHWLNA